jgi:glucosylglycerate synthase
MSPESALPPDTLAAIERLQPADVVIAATMCATTDALRATAAAVQEAGRLATPPLRSVLVHPDPGASDADVDRVEPSNGALQLVPCPLPLIGRLPFTAAARRGLFEPLALVTARAGARACGVTGTLPEGITRETLRVLVAPILEHAVDLVLPTYPRHWLDGLMNNAIVYPLTRALYGQRVEGQLGMDFGFSPRLVTALAAPAASHGAGRPVWLLTEAVERAMPIAQARVGAWCPPVEPPGDLSATLAQVLGSLFEDMEHHASVWQRKRGSQPVVTVGGSPPWPEEHRDIDVRTMIESFQIGFRNLQEVWGPVLPPATIIELSRMTRLPPERFRMPDALWARIVYDAALGHRLRLISRDHLLRAMTPLYLAWVASFASEAGAADHATAQRRIERLCSAFEAEKPYLLARWRWPDRFNP